MGYTNSAFKGIGWVGSLRLLTRVISFFQIIIMARLLSPEQFGMFGIAVLVTALLEVITETGVNVILIQEKNSIEKFLSSAWIVSIVRGVVIASIIILSASFVSDFFRSSESFPLLQLISLVPFLRGFINPATVKFQKNLEFNKELWYRLSIVIFDAIVTIFFGIITRNAICLVFGLIAGVVLELFLSFIIIRPLPRLEFHKNYLFKLFHSGKWITLSGIFNYLYHNADNITVGRILGTSSLGLYEMAYNISMLPITEISDVVSKVTFPLYSIISDDRLRLRRAFVKTISLVAFLTIPFGIILFIFSTELVNILLGSNWVGIVPALRILVIFGVIRAISGSTSALFLSVKMQNYVSIVTFVSMLGLLITIIPLIAKFGIVGAGISALIGSVASLPFMIYFTAKVFYEKSGS